MKNLADLFAQKEIRAVWDNRTEKWWFSVADICAAINDCDYKAARNYWKWLKGKWQEEHKQLVSDTNQLDFIAADGRAYFAEAMDIRGVLRLIMAFPSPKAEPFRLWLADILAENPIVAEQFAEIGAKAYNKDNPPAKRPTKHKATTVRPIPGV